MVVMAGGCRGSAQSPAATAADARVGVVDLQVVSHAHPRWPDLDAVLRQLTDVEAQLAQIPVPPPVPAAEVQRLLDDEATRQRAELARELDFLRGDSQRQMETFADDLRREGEAKLAQLQHDLGAQAEETFAAKRDELRARLREEEQQIRDEYRYPLLNLRLRAEVAGLTTEEEGKQLVQQVQALQQERDARIQAKMDELEQALVAFQKETEVAVNAKLKAAQDALQGEGQQQLSARQQAAQVAFTRAAADLEKTFQTRLGRRRREIVQAAQAPPPGRQGTYTQGLAERGRRLQSELVALREQRLRLEDSILAEVKIEVAAIAQARKVDVVLTRYVSNVAGIDITADVVAKLKR
jgi:hypothetical protein